ncbi:rod shape-determining protein MreD [Flavobacteriaceae bacterium]|nr:rod shape-determining protein MreD [Flavobacteriaceae bacterium]
MNSILFSNMVRFIMLILLQVFICNQMNFLGNINPYIYILFILLYPISTNRFSFIFVSFCLGLIIDIFLDSGGAHAAASVSIAYIRPLFLKFSFGAAYEYQAIKFKDSEFLQRIVYFALLILIHHLILFAFVIFDASKINLMISRAISSGVFTLFLTLILHSLFSQKEK